MRLLHINVSLALIHQPILLNVRQVSIPMQSSRLSAVITRMPPIVILSRYTGEGADASTKDKDGISLLALHDSERAMLDVVKNGGFGKIIVILNSVHPMEIGELADYGVDSVLWIGNPGYYGLAGVASILKGEASPSRSLG